MRADVYFERGSLHVVCQDYGTTSAAGDRVVIGDGCSESPDTDVGVRLLCRAALGMPNTPAHAAQVARQAENLREALKLPPQAIDATLVLMEAAEGRKVVTLWGDGAVGCRKRDGTILVHEVSCAGPPAPPYLSYLVSPDRLLAYAQSGCGSMQVMSWGDPSADSEMIESNTSDGIARGITFRFDGDFDAILAFTDGYKTGLDAGGFPVPPSEVLAEMLAVKGGPVPVQRRFRMMQRDRGWKFQDDFTCGGFTFLD